MNGALIRSPRTAALGRPRVARVSLAFALICATIGCSKSGDFGGFVTAEVERIGGRTVTNAAPPKLTARWNVERDDDGFYATVEGPAFEELNRVMTHLFGPPFYSVTTNASETVSQFWHGEQVGVAIQFNGRADHAEIISVRDTGDRGGGAPATGQ